MTISLDVSFHPRLAIYYNTLFLSQVYVYLGFDGFVVKTLVINLLINGFSDISGKPGSFTIVFSVVCLMITDE